MEFVIFEVSVIDVLISSKFASAMHLIVRINSTIILVLVNTNFPAVYIEHPVILKAAHHELHL